MEQRQDFPYEDIIHLTRPISLTHSTMSMRDRAAQFSAFAALSGYEDTVEETARLTEPFVELDENERELLDRKWKELCETAQKHPIVEVTVFEPDQRKTGGAYVTYRGEIKKVDAVEKRLVLLDGTGIDLNWVREIREVR